jgi:tetratricopeptide (TPR) repeat protein
MERTPSRPSRRLLARATLAVLCAGIGGFVLVPVETTTVSADDAPTLSTDERLEAIERHTERGWKAFRSGNHEEALQRMERLAKLDPENPLPKQLTARIKARTGKYEEALALATEAAGKHPADRAVEAVRFDLLRRLGRHDEASAAASAALERDATDLVARTIKGLTLEERGRRAEAMEEYDAVIAAYNRKEPPPEELSFVAQAALRAQRLSTNPGEEVVHGAVKILARRIEAQPDDVDARLLYADLFQANPGRNGQATAQKAYREILDQNSEIAEARVGLARYFLVRYDQSEAIRSCRRALQTNPSLVPAMNVLAAIHVGDGDYDKADEMWTKASAVNPLDKEARSVRAARLFIAGDKAGYAALEKEVLAYDPTYGAFYTTVADLVGERQRRYDVAAELSEKAIATDPTDDRAYVVAGVNLMNLGREEEATKRFEESIERSKRLADVTRDNFLEVLGVLKTFVTSKSERFVVRQHVSESAVMEVYLLPLLEAAWRDLSKKYGFTPEGPVLVESFHRHDDFSVRSVGFSWARTAWHEFAHVITLQMSKGQVPRWLTEGLSVHEEKARKPQWGREMEKELHDRWRNGRLLKMSEINSAFRGPDVMFAYFQGGLIADYLAETRGFEVVPKMLERFAHDVTTEAVFRDVLKMELSEFDGKFAEYVGRLVGGYRMVPRWDDASVEAFEARTKKDPKDAEAWVRLGWAHLQRNRKIDAGAALDKALAEDPDLPEAILLQGALAMSSERLDLALRHYERFLATGNDDFQCRLALARIALTVTRDSAKAVEHYEAAKRCFPRHVGRGNPYLELAKLHTGAGDAAKALKELEAYADVAQEDYGVRRQLLASYVAAGRDADLIRVAEEMIEITPFGAAKGKPPNLDVHRALAEAYLRAGRKVDAARAWRVQTLLVDMLPEEERVKAGGVAARLALGALYLELGRPVEALEQALAARRLDPESVEARTLEARAREAEGAR